MPWVNKEPFWSKVIGTFSMTHLKRLIPSLTSRYGDRLQRFEVPNGIGMKTWTLSSEPSEICLEFILQDSLWMHRVSQLSTANLSPHILVKFGALNRLLLFLWLELAHHQSDLTHSFLHFILRERVRNALVLIRRIQASSGHAAHGLAKQCMVLSFKDFDVKLHLASLVHAFDKVCHSPVNHRNFFFH